MIPQPKVLDSPQGLIGPMGSSYELDVREKAPALLRFWFVHLPAYHPVLEWYAAALFIKDRRPKFSVVPIDPETYIENGFDPTKLESCVTLDEDTIEFDLPASWNEAHGTAAALARWLVLGMVNGQLPPDKFELPTWTKAISYGIRSMISP